MDGRRQKIIRATCAAAMLCTFALCGCAQSQSASSSSQPASGQTAQPGVSASAGGTDPSQGNSGGTDTCDNSGGATAGGMDSSVGNSGGTDTCDNSGISYAGGDAVGSNYQPGVVLVTFKTTATIDDVSAALASIGARTDTTLSADDVAAGSAVAVTLPEGMSVEQGVAAAKALSCVSAAQPNYRYLVM